MGIKKLIDYWYNTLVAALSWQCTLIYLIAVCHFKTLPRYGFLFDASAECATDSPLEHAVIDHFANHDERILAFTCFRLLTIVVKCHLEWPAVIEISLVRIWVRICAKEGFR